MFAGLRSRAPGLLDRRQHPRLGELEHALGLLGVGAVGDRDRRHGRGLAVGGAEARLGGEFGRDLVGQVLLERLRALGLLGRHPRRLEREERRVGVERALLGIDRDELGGTGLAVAIEVEQRDLLHRDRARVAHALLVELLGDEERRVPVVDDRALDVAHALACGAAGDVLLGQALLLAGRGVVLRHDGREPGGREVGARVDELELAELGAAEVGPALAGGRELEHVGEAELLLRVAERARHRLPHRDHQRRAHDRGRLVGRERLIRLEVQQPPPHRGGGRPRDRLEGALGDPGLGVAGGGVDALHEDRAPVDLLALVVERLDQRDEQLLLLRRVGERDLDRVLRRRGAAVDLRSAARIVVLLAAAREPRDARDGECGEQRKQKLAAFHACNLTASG